MTRIEDPPGIVVGGTLDVGSSVFTPSALPFIDMKSKKMLAKRDHATLRHGDAAASSSEGGESSPSKRRQIHESERDEVQRCGDASTSACHDFPPSFPRQNQAQEAEDDPTILSSDQCKISTFENKEGPSIESPLRNNVFNSYPSAGIHAQSSDTDEKPEDWPTSVLTELDCVRDNHVARSPRWEEVGSPFLNGRVSSPTARSATLESTFESCETTLPTNTDSAPEPHVASTSSHVGASWTVADAQYNKSLPSEEEADELIGDKAIESEGARLLQAAAGLSNPRRGDVPGSVAVERPAAAILRALGPPRGTYAFEHLYTGPPSYQSSLSIAPTGFQPQSQEAFASSGVCVLRGPGTIQHHGFPAAPDPLNKIDDNTNPPPLILPPTAASPPDPVVRFLKELGLSPSLADSLRRVGISDDNRIRAIGALPRGPMDRIEKGLALEGIDLAACVLIRQGLKQRAIH
ncbi:hypothetical protein LXA43DRAFT_370150 [Ganoderma leucocontextum]|nr:hypothetical protein LXA43DRAFT_370150 [Ganoderma leucocontextum]